VPPAVAELCLVRPMKPSPLESILSLAASVSGLLAVFQKPLGLSDSWEWCFLILVFVFLIPLLILQRRRRASRLAAGLPPFEKSPSKRRFWLLLFLIVVASLSGPLWLPYTGTTLPVSTLIITSITSCIFAILAFVLGWRYWNKRSNQSLEPTAGSRDAQT
jgi:FtsH-binding integral membrane protein